jgi:hypothetical protein
VWRAGAEYRTLFVARGINVGVIGRGDVMACKHAIKTRPPSVIDTATYVVVSTVPGGTNPLGNSSPRMGNLSTP